MTLALLAVEIQQKLECSHNPLKSIFRDQIDTASCEFNEAKRRFDQAEKEYVDSKFDLQQKTEAKVGSI